jgi:hypothetical protein
VHRRQGARIGAGLVTEPRSQHREVRRRRELIYRHRAELTVAGNFGTLLGYLQTLQRLPGDLHWNSLQLDVAGYPQASVRLSLYTLSNRAETPFN